MDKQYREKKMKVEHKETNQKKQKCESNKVNNSHSMN